MAQRPGIRRCDLEAARKAEVMFGRLVGAITRDNVTIHFAGQSEHQDSDIDRELSSLEARHGQS